MSRAKRSAAMMGKAARNVGRAEQPFWKKDAALFFSFLVALVMLVALFPDVPDTAALQRLVDRFDFLGTYGIIGLTALETIFAPIPGFLIPIAVGIVYGIWPGSFFAWIGYMIGGTTAFWAGQIFGRPLIEKFIKKEQVDAYDDVLKRHRWMLWVFYLVPVFPMDIINYVVGVSSVRFRYFFPILAIGYGFNLLILTFFGERLVASTPNERIIFAVILFSLLVGMVRAEHWIRKRPIT
jgi:uncharacterized membrane protein YdjX (TVP38/TMEM64 family)